VAFICSAIFTIVNGDCSNPCLKSIIRIVGILLCRNGRHYGSPRRFISKGLPLLSHYARTLMGKVLWVYAAKRGNPGIWVLWLVIWRYRILEPALGCNRCYAFLYLRIFVATCMHEREGNILVVRM
jgi:hypothetical protein